MAPVAVLQGAWRRTDALFELIAPEALYDQPIALRQPVIFYLGHLPAFAWNQLARGRRGWPPLEARLDVLFARGIDPLDVEELVGNGWEWTSTPFAPFRGFAPMANYQGYSQDFFDGRHHVRLGASWATDEVFLRASFRNWFQPHYPYVFWKFRCVSRNLGCACTGRRSS